MTDFFRLFLIRSRLQPGGRGAFLNLCRPLAYFDAKGATPTVLGNAMNNYRFNFNHHMVSDCSEYWLCEK